MQYYIKQVINVFLVCMILRSESPDLVIAEEPPPPKRLSEPARITDTTKKALLECLETRRSSQPSLRGRGRGRRGRKRGRKT